MTEHSATDFFRMAAHRPDEMMHVDDIARMHSEYGNDQHGNPITMGHIAQWGADEMANERYEPEHLHALVHDVRQRGIEHPIHVWKKPDGTPFVNDGTHRYWAAAQAGLSHVPVRWSSDYLSDEQGLDDHEGWRPSHTATAHFRAAAAPNGWHQDSDHAHISRGIELEPDGGWHPDVAHRILNGTATHADILHHVDTGHVGHYWATHSTTNPNLLDDAKVYAGPREPMAHWTQHAEPGENVLGSAGVVLVGHRPHGWNPDDNPDDGLMGNSTVPEHSHIPLHEIHYSGDGETWHTLTPPAGTTVHTDGPAHSATAHFRQAAWSDEEGLSDKTRAAADRAEGDWHTHRQYLAEDHMNHELLDAETNRLAHQGHAQRTADKITEAEGLPPVKVLVHDSPNVAGRGTAPDGSPVIALGENTLKHSTLIHELTHHKRQPAEDDPDHNANGFYGDYIGMLQRHHPDPDAWQHIMTANKLAVAHMRAHPDNFPPRTASVTTEGDPHGRADRARDDRPRGRSGDPAAAGDGRRPQLGQPERAEGPARRVRAAAEVERHPELQGDLDRLGGGARHVQDTITALQHGRSGVTTYPLSHPLEGWHAAITGGGHQVVHRVDPDTKTLHVGYAGHNVADAEERLGASGGEHSALPVEFHKGAERDFDGLHPEVQEKALNTIDRLSRGEAHPADHSLHGTMSAWRSARADFLTRVTHRFEDNQGNPTSYEKAHRLFIGHIGPHNYEAAEKRLASLTDFFRATDLPHRQAAAVDNSGGVMVAFVPPPEVAAQLALHGGQTADDLHITLAYLGNASDYTKEQLTLLPQLVSAWAMRQKPVTIRIGGVGKFNNAFKDQHVLWAHPDIPGGVQMHVSLARELEQYGFKLPSEHGWTAHMTLRFVDKHFRFMPHLPEIGWEATEVVTFIGSARHAARLGLRPSTPTTL